MKPPFFAATEVATLMACTLARGQVASSTAKIDAQPLELRSPDRYRIPSILEPVRRVTLIATTDAILRNQEAKAGALARDGQVVAQLDRTVAGANLVERQFTPRPPNALNLDLWHEVANHALNYWSRVREEERLSLSFRRISAGCRDSLARFIGERS